MRNDDARAADQGLLNERLLQLERNQERLIEALSKLGNQAGGILIKTDYHRYASGRCHGNDGVAPVKA
jgi:hypothetical protein